MNQKDSDFYWDDSNFDERGFIKYKQEKMKYEEGEQKAFFGWVELNKKKIPALQNMLAIPLGGSRDEREAKNLRLSGVRAGYPDILMDWASNGFHGLKIEMKTIDGKLTVGKWIRNKAGKITHWRDGQKEWKERLEAAGFCYRICRTCEESILAVQEYLNIIPFD